MRLEGRVVLVIGGASGLGRASAEACANDGASVVVADVNGHSGKEVVAEIQSHGRSAVFVATDIVDECVS